MRAIVAFALPCVVILIVASGAAFCADAGKADTTWIARCMSQLVTEHADTKARRVYCTCMHDYFEDNEQVSQTGMERMFPPAHRLCHGKAGW